MVYQLFKPSEMTVSIPALFFKWRKTISMQFQMACSTLSYCIKQFFFFRITRCIISSIFTIIFFSVIINAIILSFGSFITLIKVKKRLLCICYQVIF